MMAKYIVEAPEPRDGQKVSSGGIRENGKLASQFKNPIPYEDPTPTPSDEIKKSDPDLARKESARARKQKVGLYLLGLAWQEFGEPLFCAVLHKLKDMFISKIEAPVKQPEPNISSYEPEVVDVEADEVESICENDKIIRFPNSKVS